MVDASPLVSDSEDIAPFEDALAPARGIAIGAMLSVPLWAVIVGIVWAVL